MDNEIKKLKFQIQLIAETLSLEEHPIPVLVANFDWSEEDLSVAHDIFESYSEKLKAGSDFNAVGLEGEFKSRFNISYQGFKIVVLAFFYNRQWVDVCRAYAKARTSIELHPVLEFEH